MNPVVDRLLYSDEPSIRYKVRVGVLGEEPHSIAIRRLQSEIRQSPLVGALLQNRDEQGRVRPLHHTYKKWVGAHWVFARLADIGYPPGDESLIPIRDQVLETWLHPKGIREVVYDGAVPERRRRMGVPVVNGRARRCAAQQGNGLFSAVALGLMDDRCDRLARLLIRWQWPDGGWNCDRRAEAVNSSFWESLIPLRGLAWYAKATGDRDAGHAAQRASEIFLKRRLFRRISDGQVMNEQFTKLHYPCYWRYDILFALKVLAEAGFIGDPRCGEALDLLQSKQLPDGGWPAEARYYGNANPSSSGYDMVSWGGVNRRKLNPWVTVDALCVLHRAGRFSIEQPDSGQAPPRAEH